MRKLKFVSVFLVLAMLLIASSNVVMGQEPVPNEDGPRPEGKGETEATRVIAETPDLHEDWPVVKVETWETKDELGQVHKHQCVYRRKPSNSSGPLVGGEQCGYDQPTGKYQCYKSTKYDDRYCTDTAGGLTEHMWGDGEAIGGMANQRHFSTT